MNKLTLGIITFIAAFLLMMAPASAKSDHGNSQKEHGANQDGSYTAEDPPVTDPSNDYGNRPSDGSVGNADNQNPPGQAPDGSDHNNGYECDGNPGVGHGNPAHSACGTTTTVVDHGCPPGQYCAPETVHPNPHKPTATTPTVFEEVVDGGTVHTYQPTSDELARTGSSTWVLVGIAVTALLIGLSLLRYSIAHKVKE